MTRRCGWPSDAGSNTVRIVHGMPVPALTRDALDRLYALLTGGA